LCLGDDAPEAARRREDGDALITAERAQIIIARDDRLGAGGERAGEDVDVFGIAQFWNRDFRRRDERGKLGIAGKQEAGLNARRVDLGLDLRLGHGWEPERFDLVERGKKLADSLLTKRLPKNLLQRGLIQEPCGPDLPGKFVGKLHGQFSHVGDPC